MNLLIMYFQEYVLGKLLGKICDPAVMMRFSKCNNLILPLDGAISSLNNGFRAVKQPNMNLF